MPSTGRGPRLVLYLFVFAQAIAACTVQPAHTYSTARSSLVCLSGQGVSVCVEFICVDRRRIFHSSKSISTFAACSCTRVRTSYSTLAAHSAAASPSVRAFSGASATQRPPLPLAPHTVRVPLYRVLTHAATPRTSRNAHILAPLLSPTPAALALTANMYSTPCAQDR